MSGNLTVFDISWEVCNMVGGIHTVLASKIGQMQARYGDDYVAIGPDISRMDHERPVFREERWEPGLLEALSETRVHARMGRWLIPGEPRALLINYGDVYPQKDSILAHYWERFRLDSLFGDWDYYDPLMFAHAAGMVVERYALDLLIPRRKQAVVNAHEWMAGGAILYLRERLPEVGSILTTHATTLGRALASHHRNPDLYATLPSLDPDAVARELGVAAKHSMECVAARECDVMTTVSSITALECEYLLGRKPDLLLPNGMGDDFPPREYASAESKIGARRRLIELAQCTTGDTYDSENTTLILSSGRYEYTNKGLDVYARAAARLGQRLNDGDPRVIAFAACPAGHAGPNRCVLRAQESGEKVDHPHTTTHDLRHPEGDPIQQELQRLGLSNVLGARVHFIQIPIYLDGTDPLIPETYYELLTGFDVSAFPSFYEPWGYTPMESLAFGVPTVSSDLAGFGQWVASLGDWNATGCDVLRRNGVAVESVVDDLCERLLDFVKLPHDRRRELDALAMTAAARAQWSEFAPAYFEAHEMAREEAAQRSRRMPTSRFLELSQRQVVTTAFKGEGEGDVVTAHLRQFVVHNELPEPLLGLGRLARNLWWHWHPTATALFETLDPELWAQTGHNPMALLEQVSQDRLAGLANSPDYCAALDGVTGEFAAATSTEVAPEIAYFCMEFGLASCLRIYSGGLGILAGDHLKTASDMGAPLCAVGLAFAHGYFHQRIDIHGQQQSSDDSNDFSALGVESVSGSDGEPLELEIPFPGRRVHLHAYRVRVGRVQLYLLDTNHPANDAADRGITDRLYGGDHAHRLQQEMVLGVGGHLLLTTLGISPRIFHLNEGHSAFLILARLAHLVRDAGLKYEEALDYVRHTTVFTTHTPVAAGHDQFDESLVRPYLAPFTRALNCDLPTLVRMGQPRSRKHEGRFGTTQLAIRGSLRINGVSEIHGGVTRAMFRDEFPDYHAAEIPVGSVTNGVHVPTWLAPEIQRLCAEHVGASWSNELTDERTWSKVRDIPNAEIWGMHQARREILSEVLRRDAWNRWRERGGPALRSVIDTLNADPLIMTFARRFAPYKRAGLIFDDIDRLAGIIQDGVRPVLLVFAGKAHPHDGQGRDLLARVVEMSQHPKLSGHVALLENYDIDVAKVLVSGSDVWLNTPTRPLEASGTSGIKAGINGCLNLSVADGWWAEGFNGSNGWVIGPVDAPDSEVVPREHDGDLLYAHLERSVLPVFCARNDDGVPDEWVHMMKESIATLVPRFSSARMFSDYQHLYYGPALSDARVLRNEEFSGLHELRSHKRAIAHHWGDVTFADARIGASNDSRVSVGKSLPVHAKLRHPGLSADALEVQVVSAEGPIDGKLDHFDTQPMLCVSENGDGASDWQGDVTFRTGGAHAIGLRVVPRRTYADRDIEIGMHLVRWL